MKYFKVIMGLVAIAFLSTVAYAAFSQNVAAKTVVNEKTTHVVSHSEVKTTLDVAVNRLKNMSEKEQIDILGTDDSKIVTAVPENTGYGLLFGEDFSVKDENGKVVKVARLKSTTVGEIKKELAAKN